MNRFVIALFMGIVPFTTLAYYYVAKVLMSGTEAASYVEHGGSIATEKLHDYYAVMMGAGLFGIVCAFLLALAISEVLQKRNLKQSDAGAGK